MIVYDDCCNPNAERAISVSQKGKEKGRSVYCRALKREMTVEVNGYLPVMCL